jgi:hypothetical protein
VIVICFFLVDSPASEVYMPTFLNTLSHLHRQVSKYMSYEVSYIAASEDGTGCSEMLACKLQTLANHPEDGLQLRVVCLNRQAPSYGYP